MQTDEDFGWRQPPDFERRAQQLVAAKTRKFVMAVTAAQAVHPYSHRTSPSQMEPPMPTTNTIDRTEANDNELVKKAERRAELLDTELDTITGGLTSFQWGVGRGIGSAMSGQS